MQITVELFGIARLKAGVSTTSSTGATLGEVLSDLAERYPALSNVCISGQSLMSGFTANLRGEQFICDPATSLRDGDSILLLSVDAGG
jgi:sulfur-carrier protein